MAVERFQSTLVFPIKCWQKVKFLNSSSSKIKTKQLWVAMQTEPRQRIPMHVRMTDCRKPTQTAGRFSHGVRGQKWIFRQADLQALPEVFAFAFIIYLKKAIRALSFCVVDQYPIFAFLPRTKLQVIKSAPGWFLGGGNIATRTACQENSIDLIANYTFQKDRAKEKYFIMQSRATNVRKK